MPDVLGRVEFRRSGWQQDDREVLRYDEIFGLVPAGSIHNDDAMTAGRDGQAYLFEMELHGGRVDDG